MKILHADDHILFREGICHILRQLDAGLEYLEAGAIQAVLDILKVRNDIDLILLEPYRPSMNGCTGFRTIWECNPTIPIIILSASEHHQDIATAIGMGAAGYIPKSSTAQTFLNALRLVLEGGIYAPRTGRNGAGSRGELPDSLTKRPWEVLTLMAEGLSNKAIAKKLFITEATVKGHVTAILDVLGVENRVQAINKARQSGRQWRAAVE